MKNNSKMSQLFSKVRSLFAEMKSVQSDKGELFFDGELAVDTEVFLKTGEDFIPAPTGEYLVDGTLYKVTDGVVIEAEKTEAPVEDIPEPASANVEELACGDKPKEELAEEPIEPVVEGTVVEPVMAPEQNPDYVTRAEFDDLAARVAALEALAKPTNIPIDENTRYSRVMRFCETLKD